MCILGYLWGKREFVFCVWGPIAGWGSYGIGLARLRRVWGSNVSMVGVMLLDLSGDAAYWSDNFCIGGSSFGGVV